jgi:phage gp45-like
VIRTVNKLLAPLRNQLANLVARAVVQLVNDGAKLQVVQLGVLEGETRAGCERFQEYGFTSVPLPGAEAVVLFVGGRRDHALVVAVDDRRHRPTDLEAGDSALYHHAGPRVLAKSDRVVADAPEVRLGSDAASDFVALASLVLDELNAVRAAFNTHIHTNVTAGSGTSGGPGMPMPEPGSVAAGKVKAE